MNKSNETYNEKVFLSQFESSLQEMKKVREEVKEKKDSNLREMDEDGISI